MKKQEVESAKQRKGLPQDTYFSLERELHEKNKKVLDLESQKGLTEMLNSDRNDGRGLESD